MNDFFDKAVETVLDHEGEFSNHEADKGGATMFGISLRFLKDYTNLNPKDFDRFDLDNDQDIDAADIRGLTRDGAIYLYRSQFWFKNNYQHIKNYQVAAKIFDLSVNIGGKQAHKLLQRAIRAASGTILLEDGVLGPKTMQATNAADPFALVSALKSEAAGFYRLLTHVDPKLAVFLNGWLLRAYY